MRTMRVISDNHSGHGLPIGATVESVPASELEPWQLAGGASWWTQGGDGDEVSIDPRDLTPLVKGCVCAHNTDGTVTTSLCPMHADQDPCLTMAQVTGRRRKGTIRKGVCSSCGWTETRTS